MFRNIWEYTLVWIIVSSYIMIFVSVIAYLFYWRMSIFFKKIEKNVEPFMIYIRAMKNYMEKHNEHHRRSR